MGGMSDKAARHSDLNLLSEATIRLIVVPANHHIHTKYA
jgi:hypothetical protein